jgi:uncharacterized protein
MDSKFHPAVAAINAGDIERLQSLLKQNPALATDRSSCSHPTLLQCLALDAVNVGNKVAMARVLIDAGAEINGPLLAAACIDNVEVTAALLDAGAAIDGRGGWSPLEEALYWGNHRVIELLLDRGAAVHNLRMAAGLGRVDLIDSFFARDGSLKPEAGRVDSPFDKERGKWPNAPRDIINNAFIYACMHNRLDAAKWLLQRGAEVNAIPPGFDFAGTGLHYAALNGHKAMVDFLLDQGADPRIKDTKVGSTPSGWAAHGGHSELKDYLDQRAGNG